MRKERTEGVLAGEKTCRRGESLGGGGGGRGGGGSGGRGGGGSGGRGG